MRRLTALLSLVLVLALSAVAAADEPPRYEVELILFSQAEAVRDDGERPPLVPPAPFFARWGVPEGCGVLTEDTYDMRCLDDERRKLDGARRSLERADGYRVLVHLAWEQPGWSEADSVAVPVPLYWVPPGAALPLGGALEDGEREPDAGPEEALGPAQPTLRLEPPLHGFVRVFRERFLHAVVDLRYTDAALGEAARAAEWPLAVHTMRDRRRMRSGQRHYLDHPVLGVLIEVREVEEEDG